MKKLLIVGTTILVFAGCSVADRDAPTGDPEKTLSAEPTADAVEDAVSGRPLSEFEGSPTYEWRKAIAADPERILDEMQAIAPHLTADDFSDVLDTCSAAAQGTTGAELTEQAAVRFSGGAGEEVTADQAEALVGVVRAAVCP